MDFMNLNQAAHGDREFGYIETRMRVRRKTVVGHAQTTRRAASGSLTGPGPRSGSTPRRTCGWPGSATTCATSR